MIGEMRRWAVARIMEDVTFLPSTESVGSRERVTVRMVLFGVGKGVKWPKQTGERWGWRWILPR